MGCTCDCHDDRNRTPLVPCPTCGHKLWIDFHTPLTPEQIRVGLDVARRHGLLRR